MTSIGTGYDLYTSQFSPDGRVFQVGVGGRDAVIQKSQTALFVIIRLGDSFLMVLMVYLS